MRAVRRKWFAVIEDAFRIRPNITRSPFAASWNVAARRRDRYIEIASRPLDRSRNSCRGWETFCLVVAGILSGMPLPVAGTCRRAEGNPLAGGRVADGFGDLAGRAHGACSVAGAARRRAFLSIVAAIHRGQVQRGRQRWRRPAGRRRIENGEAAATADRRQGKQPEPGSGRQTAKSEQPADRRSGERRG